MMILKMAEKLKNDKSIILNVYQIWVVIYMIKHTPINVCHRDGAANFVDCPS